MHIKVKMHQGAVDVVWLCYLQANQASQSTFAICREGVPYSDTSGQALLLLLLDSAIWKHFRAAQRCPPAHPLVIPVLELFTQFRLKHKSHARLYGVTAGIEYLQTWQLSQGIDFTILWASCPSFSYVHQLFLHFQVVQPARHAVFVELHASCTAASCEHASDYLQNITHALDG